MQLSSDGHLVVCHDKDTLRTTGIAGKISELTLAQIQALDAGAFKGEAWKGERIPTLDQVLASLPSDKRLFIELKGNSTLVSPVEEAIKRSTCTCEQLVLIGFDIPAMQEAKRRLPHHAVLLLYGFSQNEEESLKRWQPRIESLIARAKEVGADGLNLCYTTPDDLKWIEKVKAAGLKACVWTVDDPIAAKYLIDAGIEVITTNRPGWLQKQLMRE